MSCSKVSILSTTIWSVSWVVLMNKFVFLSTNLILVIIGPVPVHSEAVLVLNQPVQRMYPRLVVLHLGFITSVCCSAWPNLSFSCIPNSSSLELSTSSCCKARYQLSNFPEKFWYCMVVWLLHLVR